MRLPSSQLPRSTSNKDYSPQKYLFTQLIGDILASGWTNSKITHRIILNYLLKTKINQNTNLFLLTHLQDTFTVFHRRVIHNILAGGGERRKSTFKPLGIRLEAVSSLTNHTGTLQVSQ